MALSNHEYQQTMSTLLDPFKSISDLINRLLGVVEWDKEKIREMNLRLLDARISTDLVTALNRWSYFLIDKTSSSPKINRILVSARDVELGHTLSECFGFAEAETPIPYILWSTIAPHMMSQAQRSYFADLINFKP